MAKKATKQTTNEQEEREAHIAHAYADLEKAKTADDVRAVWKEHYLLIGHRVLGRLLLGQDVASATRRRQAKKD